VKTSKTILFFVAGILLLSQSLDSCRKKDASSTYNPTFLQQQIPEGFPAPSYTFSKNPLTKEGFELGRKLFYEGRLSIDGKFPCSSCHQQFAAFATFDHSLSHGYNNSFTTRNAPGLWNLAWQKEFHHDGSYKTLEAEAVDPITAPNQMSESIENVLNKLKNDAGYKTMFKAAFGDETINSERMLKALAQFTGSIISADSKYDRVKKGQASFTSFEQRGETLFMSKCATCHTPPLFTDFSYRNTGLTVNASLNDYGRLRITNNPADSLKFKVPSLRNVDITFPYMHDGRFGSVQQCIEHYSNGVQYSTTVDPLLVNGIPLTNPEVIDLVQFLKTLTDSTLLQDSRFSKPPL
jgi:cytochrome c peroxidase